MNYLGKSIHTTVEYITIFNLCHPFLSHLIAGLYLRQIHYVVFFICIFGMKLQKNSRFPLIFTATHAIISHSKRHHQHDLGFLIIFVQWYHSLLCIYPFTAFNFFTVYGFIINQYSIVFHFFLFTFIFVHNQVNNVPLLVFLIIVTKVDFLLSASSCWTFSSPRRPLFLHALSFECTSKLCIPFLNQFFFKWMHYTI